jgi:glutaryl-CoA transferase
VAGPLAHICVLDLSRILAGPWASMTLADLGAEVIKVEQPGQGDDTRTWGPPFADAGGGQRGDAAYFLCVNRGKKSVTIDFTRPEGQQLIQSLARRSDVVIENFKVGGLAKYGLDYPSLHRINPRLVYCSITGFGQTGPCRHRAGYDFMIQGMSGLMSITGLPDGAPGGMPMKVGVAISDVLCGLYAAIGVLAALAHRDRTGRGQHIDLALLDVQVAALANQALNYLVSGRPPGRLGNAHPNIVPYEVFQAADGHFILAVGNDGQFRRFCEVAGRPDLSVDLRFATNPARVENRAVLVPLLADVIAVRRRADWLTALEAAGVPCGPINTLDQVFDDSQLGARGLRLDLPYGDGGTAPSVACPIKLSVTPAVPEQGPPRLGAQTDAVLAGVLGLDAHELDRLRAAGVI